RTLKPLTDKRMITSTVSEGIIPSNHEAVSFLAPRHLANTEATLNDQLIIFDGHIENVPARVLIDSGAVGNYVSESLSKKIMIPETRGNHQVKVTIADGRSYNCGLLKDAKLKIETYFDQLDFIIAPIVYDVILGKTWLTKFNPKIDWKRNILFFRQEGLNHQWRNSIS